MSFLIFLPFILSPDFAITSSFNFLPLIFFDFELKNEYTSSTGLVNISEGIPGPNRNPPDYTVLDN